MSFSLRRLELADLDAIERIERASYPTPWSRSMFAGELAKQSSLSIAAVTRDEQLVGYLVLSRYVDAWHVMNVAVDPEHRRHGIASAMLQRLFEVTRDDAERGYTLEVRVSNLAAIKLYESFGFVSRGVRRGYYTDNREDAVIMWRDPDPDRDPDLDPDSDVEPKGEPEMKDALKSDTQPESPPGPQSERRQPR